MLLRVFLFAILVLMLYGCTTLPRALPLSDANNVSELTQWQMRGKLAIITSAERRAVNFFWQRNAANYQTVLTTSLGISVFSAQRDELGITVKVDDQQYQSATPEQLLFDLTGWRLPVEQFNHWLIADVEPKDGLIERDAQGYITHFSPRCEAACQTPLRIQYAQYRRVNKLALPHSIKVTTPQQTLTFKITQWQ